MVSYYVTFGYGEFFSEPNSSPHETSRGFISLHSKPHKSHVRLEALLELLNHRIDEQVWCLVLLEGLWWFLVVWNIIIPSVFPLASPPTSLFTIPKQQYTKKTRIKEQQEQVTIKFSEWKQVHVGMEPYKTNQTRWKWHNNTFTPSLATSCATFAQHLYYRIQRETSCRQW